MKVKTACPIDCYDGCSVLVSVDERGHITMEGNPDHPITKGTLCNRGRQLAVRRDSPQRILHPLKRIGDRFVQISWEQAIAEIGQALQKTLDSVGNHGVLHIFDWGSGGVLKNLNQRFFYGLGGCTETVGSLCWDAGLEAQTYDFGRADSHSPDDMANSANAVVVWGRNVANTNVHMMPYIKQAQQRGAKLVVISTLEQDLGRRADRCIYPRPGSDGILALGILRICRDHGWIDKAFIDQFSVGWDELSQELDAYSVDLVASLTDVSPDDIHWLADLYGNQGPVATLLGLGMQRYSRGGNTVRAIDALAAATGQIGVPGGGVNYAQRQVGRFFDEESIMGRKSADVRTFERTTQAAEILAADPPIRIAFVTRTNPAVQVPDSQTFRKAFASIGCKVVIDTFLTKTAELADYVLPCTNVLEEEDVTYTTMWHPYVSYIRPVVPPKGEAKPDWQIFRDLAGEIGRAEIMAGTVDEWLDAALAPFGKAAIDELRETGFIRLPIEDVPWARRVFLTPSGKFEFSSEWAKRDGHSPVARCLPEGADVESHVEYPYALLTTHPRKMQNSQRDTERNLDTPTVEVPQSIAEQKGLAEGALARVFNDRASVVARIVIRPGGHAGTLRLEAGWYGQGMTTNDFTTASKADFGSQSAQYECRCNIESITG